MKNMVLCIPRFCLAAVILLTGTVALAANVTGTVTNKTTGKPSAGDTVVLIDVSAGMSEAATATTDKNGHYSLQPPGMGSYLVRVNHQGATYFIAAPQGNAPGDVTVYDVAAKLDGVGIDADMLLVEGAGGTLRVQERFLIRNTSLPPKAMFSDKTFEIYIPAEAELDGASATRPGGMGTNTRLVPLSGKGHYTFNIPIQPDKGEKETMFEVQYHIPYSGKFTFTPQLQMHADNLVVYVPKGMTFTAGQGDFGSAQEDPRVQTYIHKNIQPGQKVSFTVSGEGQMPRDEQQQRPSMGGATLGTGTSDSAVSSGPGGGIGAPIATPDPLTRYKWWILGALALLLAGAAWFLLRKQPGALAAFAGMGKHAPIDGDPVASVSNRAQTASHATAQASAASAGTYASGEAALLNSLKEELFELESERLAGTISAEDYAQAKAGLEAVLKRALKKS